MKYVTGLVVGKFCPLHKGHEFLIKTSLEQCEKVIVLSYTSKVFKGCDAASREEWLKRIDCDQDRLDIHVIDDFVYIDDDAPEDQHRQLCAEYLLNVLETSVQAVFSSESYGDGFAAHLSKYFTDTFPKQPLTVDHIMVDWPRSNFPISGTRLREAIASGDNTLVDKFMSPGVSPSFVRKILFLGGESTGKSTLVMSLFKHFNSAAAPEFGRVHYDNRNQKLMYEDMAYIAKTQIAIEDERARHLNPDQYLFCDTSPLTTLFYSKEWFGRVANSLTELMWGTEQRYHKIYLCAPDFPMVQDGTRQDETFRMKGHAFYVDHLEDTWMCDYTVLTGTHEERLAKVITDLKG